MMRFVFYNIPPVRQLFTWVYKQPIYLCTRHLADTRLVKSGANRKTPEVTSSTVPNPYQEHFSVEDRIDHPSTSLVHLFETEDTSGSGKRYAFFNAIDRFRTRSGKSRGIVEFLYTAMSQMQPLQVHKDLAAYKELFRLFPVDTYVVRNWRQKELFFFPLQQACALRILDQMEYHEVIPDKEIARILVSVFGRRSDPAEKLSAYMYWKSKFMNICPWHLPDQLPTCPMRLSYMAVQQAVSVDPRCHVQIYTSDDIRSVVAHGDAAEIDEDMWLVSAQSEEQRCLLQQHARHEPLNVTGPHTMWLRECALSYYVLSSVRVRHSCLEPLDCDDISYLQNYMWLPACQAGGCDPPAPGTSFIHDTRPDSVHVQEHARADTQTTVLAVCASSSGSRHSLLLWLRVLQAQCSSLRHRQVVLDVDQTAVLGSNPRAAPSYTPPRDQGGSGVISHAVR